MLLVLLFWKVNCIYLFIYLFFSRQEAEDNKQKLFTDADYAGDLVLLVNTPA